MPSPAGALLFVLLLFYPVFQTQRLTGHPPEPIVAATVECFTTADPTTPLVIEVYSNWSPHGAERFIELVNDGYYDKAPLFRVVKNFIVQFGISLDPALESKWGNSKILDDTTLGFPFDRGYISFAGGGRNSRATQVFIAYSARGTQHLGKVPHETPFGRVVKGMEVADKFFDGDGQFSMDMKPWGLGPEQGKIKRLGANYLRQEYPKISYITKCKVISTEPQSEKEFDNDVGPTTVNDASRNPDENDAKWKRWRSSLDRRRTKEDLNPEKRRSFADLSGDKIEGIEIRRKLNRKSSRLNRRTKFEDDDDSA